MADLIYMAKTKWTALLDSIRAKGGTSALMTADQAKAAVDAIPTGGGGGGGGTALSGEITLVEKLVVPKKGASTSFPGVQLGFQPDIFFLSITRQSYDAVMPLSGTSIKGVLAVKKQFSPPYKLASNVSTDSADGDYVWLDWQYVVASTDTSSGYAINGTSTWSAEYFPPWGFSPDGEFLFGRISSNPNVYFPAATYRYFALRA